jgi:transposase InsO family protein/predicted DNA-binding transcriptional regulator AlpA
MRIENIYSGVDSSCFRLISPEINYLKDEFIKKKKKQYDCFKLLLEKNRKIKKKEDRLTYKEITKISGISRPTYYRLKKELEIKDWKGIERKSTRPRNVRQSKIPLETKELILKLRLENITYGKDKLKVILKRDYDIKIGSDSINRILNEYKSRNKIPKYSPSQTLKKRHRRFDKKGVYAQKWDYEKHCVGNTKLNIKLTEGELMQVDHMTITKNNITMKQFTAIDPTTRMIISEVYSNATSFTALKFLIEKVLNGFPFNIKSIQVDGGSEFMKYFEDGCKRYNIPLYILPPHKPKYNGRVERSNRIMREEFYGDNELLKLTDSLGGFRNKLREFIDKYNSYRPHRELDYLTPMEYYEKRMIKVG